MTLDAARGASNGQPFAHLQDAVKAATNRIGEPPRQFLLARMIEPDTYFRAMERAVIAETQRRVVVTAIALKRFERRTGKLPAELSALVPALLAAVPIDPMDGHSLRYRLAGTNSFLLYSIGLDGVDGNGDTSPVTPGSKIMHWTQCKDFVWPQPATAEQLREFNSKMEQQRTGKPPKGRR